MTYEGIVILGCPRSGTTLLRRLLDSHPAVRCPPETGVLSGCARFLEEVPFGEDLSLGVVPGLAFSGIAEDDVLDRLRALAFGLLADVAGRSGKRLWAEKTAFDAFHARQISRLCGGRVRYVLLFRHGLDVAVSMAELVERIGVHPPELHAYIRRFPRPLEAYARAWADVSQSLLELAGVWPDHARILRYEDLVADPSAELTALWEWLGLPTEPARSSAVDGGPGLGVDSPGLGDWKTYQRAAIDRASIGRWRELPAATRRVLGTVCNPVLARLGYPEVPVPEAVPASRARRRLQLGLLGSQLTGGDEGG